MTDRLDDLARSLAAEDEAGGPVGRRSVLRRGLALFGLGAAAVVAGAPAAGAAPKPPQNPCPPGLTPCGGLCRDLTDHNGHCGACGNVCKPDEVCRNGQCTKLPCTCPPPCTPKTCAQVPAGTCGQVADGCGGTITCGCPYGSLCQDGTCVDDPSICASAADCPPSSEPCSTAACADGTCVTTAAPAGTTCPSGVCDGAGACVQCVAPTDCPGTDTECQHRTCTNGTCGTSFTPAGTPLAQQTAGDCRTAVCDGSGGTTTQPDGADVPADDGNPCTTQVCQGGVPTTTPAPNGTACPSGTCQDGTCVTCRPQTCAQMGKSCGTHPDGCGGTVSCGSCSAPQTCFPDGVCRTPCSSASSCPPAGPCSTAVCNQGVCSYQPVPSGTTCPGGTCNGSGSCVQTCTPRTCAQIGATCGVHGDGCGGSISCGTCSGPNEVCNGRTCVTA